MRDQDVPQSATIRFKTQRVKSNGSMDCVSRRVRRRRRFKCLLCVFCLVVSLQRYNATKPLAPRQGRTIEVVDMTRLEAGLPANFFSRSCSSPATIVTAYYNLKRLSKHSEANFKKWNARFFSLSDNMVIFSDWDSLKRIIALRRNSRGCTLLVRQKLSDTEMFHLTDWDSQHSIDPEKAKHHVALYIIWDQKPLWMEAVAKQNPFQSTHFFWADSGQFRDDVFSELTSQKVKNGSHRLSLFLHASHYSSV